MKTKKRYLYGVLLLSLLVSLFLLCFGIRNIATASAEAPSSTESTIDTMDTVTEEELTAENFNSKIKAWIDTIIGGAGIGLDALLIALLSKKKSQTVDVTVNDKQTQEKLEALNAEYTNLKKLLVDVFQMTKGTFEVLTTLFANNKSIDENIRNTIKSISINSEDIIKDVDDLLDADTHKAVKTALQGISNIVLG